MRFIQSNKDHRKLQSFLEVKTGILFNVDATSNSKQFILFILEINQLDAQNLFYNKFISYLYVFRAPCAHRQEVKIVLYTLWYHHTYRCDEVSSHL